MRLRAALIAALLALALVPGVMTAATSPPVNHGEVSAALEYPCYPDTACPTLSVEPMGDGSGRWQSVTMLGALDGNIDCHVVKGAIVSGPCSHQYLDLDQDEMVLVYYVMTADEGSEACLPGECGPIVSSSLSLSAEIDTTHRTEDSFRRTSYSLTVKTGGTGSGSVVSTPAGINCGATCKWTVERGTSVLLTAVPATGSTFTSWTGACTGQSADCLIAIVADTTTTARFATPGIATPAPSKAPTSTPGAVTPPPTLPAQTSVPGSTSPIETGAAATGEVPTGSGSPTAPPAVPAAGSTDSTPLALALFAIAGLLIVGGIGFVAFRIGRDRASPSA